MHVFPDNAIQNIYEDVLDEQSQHVDTLLQKSAAIGLIKNPSTLERNIEKHKAERIDEKVKSRQSKHCVRCHKGWLRLKLTHSENIKSSAILRKHANWLIRSVTWCCDEEMIKHHFIDV